MQLLLQQVMAGLANGAIYACMALAVVMIYQAIDHLNFAQGEMAMFSTFIAWQLIHWGMPYWVAFLVAVVLSFIGGVAIERILFRPLHNAPILANLVAFIALFSILNSGDGYIWDYQRSRPFRPRSAPPLFGSVLIDTHEAGMIGVTAVMLGLLYLFFRGTRLGLAMRRRRRQSGIGAARRHPRRLDDGARLGHGGGDRRGRRHADRAGRVSRAEHDVRRPALRVCRRRPRRAVEPGRRRAGGFAVGVIENLAGTFIPYVGRDLKLTIALVLIVAVLMVRPAGIFGRSVVSRV